MVFEYQGHFMKGSELGRECNGSNLAKTIDAQRDTVLAQRAAVALVGQQSGQLGAELELFGQEAGAQKQANEKAAQQALEQKLEQAEQTKREAAQRQQEQAERAEKAAKQAAPPPVEKTEKQALDPHLRRGPTIEKSDEIEM